MNKPKVIFIDWYNTLSRSKFWEHLADQNRNGVSVFEQITSSLFVDNNDQVRLWMLGKLSSKDICEFIANETGLGIEFIHSELVTSCKNMEYVSDRVEPLLKKIRERSVKIVIATDNMDTFAKYTYGVANSENLYDGYLSSYELGCFKYDCINNNLPFFDVFLEKNGLGYNDCVLIDDSIDKKGNLKRLGLEIINISNQLTLEDALSIYAWV